MGLGLICGNLGSTPQTSLPTSILIKTFFSAVSDALGEF